MALLVAACSTDEVLRVERPDIIDPGSLATAQGATALYNGAIGDYALAQDGGFVGGLGVIIASGFMSDEFAFGGTPPEVRAMDLRNVIEANNAWKPVYLNIHRARESAEKAAKAVKAVATAADRRVGESYALEALSIILLAENYCSGVPLSTTDPELVYGEPLTTQQLFQEAIAKLDLAGQNTATDARIVNLVAVARGRALLNLGQFAAAATAVAAVPTSYEYRTFHGTTTDRQKSIMYSYMFNSDSWLVSDREGINGLNFGTANDPRVPIQNDGISRFDARTPAYKLKKYDNFSASVVTASGVEARLIEAEAALQAGNNTLWLTKLNDARTFFTMGAATDPGTPAGRIDLMFRERAFSLFATAHRLGDLRRLIRQYSRGAETVFPTGAYHKDNLTRGPDVNIVIPDTERNNPNFNGCISRGA